MEAGLEIIDQLKRKGLVYSAGMNDGKLELVSTGLESVDSLCSGGLARGRISEIVTGSRGGALLLAKVLARATNRGAAAVVDPGYGFDPVSASAQGVSLERLLWVLARGGKQALRAAELILASEEFHTLVLDLVSSQGIGFIAPWMRIDRLARRTNTLVLVFSASGVVGPFAHTVLSLRASRPVWQRGGGGKSNNCPFWLAGVDLDFAILRRRSA